jgi:hypothetical protein
MSHFFEAHTTSRLQGAPAACGGLQTCGVTAKMQTLPSLQSASALHSSAAKDADDINDKEWIIAVDNKTFLSMVRYLSRCGSVVSETDKVIVAARAYPGGLFIPQAHSLIIEKETGRATYSFNNGNMAGFLTAGAEIWTCS